MLINQLIYMDLRKLLFLCNDLLCNDVAQTRLPFLWFTNFFELFVVCRMATNNDMAAPPTSAGLDCIQVNSLVVTMPFRFSKVNAS
jgi:hypothetical protein